MPLSDVGPFTICLDWEDYDSSILSVGIILGAGAALGLHMTSPCDQIHLMWHDLDFL